MIKLVPYILKSTVRNRGRSLLTVLGVGVAVLIVVGLASILESRTRAIEASSETVIVVSEKDQY
jgi:hypothetical protein